MRTTVLFYLFAAVIQVFGADGGFTITTTDGHTYTNAIITELRPNGVVVSSDTGIVTVPYAHLPKDIQQRYAYDATALAKQLKQGIDGTYACREDIVAFGGEIIELKQGQFTYTMFSDVIIDGEDYRPLRGRFTITGNWLVLQHPKIQNPARVISIIGGRIALLMPYHYKRWKDSGKLDAQNYLYRQKPK